MKKHLLLLLLLISLLPLAACRARTPLPAPGEDGVIAKTFPAPGTDAVLPNIDAIAEPETEPVTEAETAPPWTGLYRPEVMMYHLVTDNVWSPYAGLFVSPATLREQLAALRDAGYAFMFADEYADRPDRTVILTFDDGYDDNYTELLPILREFDAVATVYIIRDLVGTTHYLTEAQIVEMAQSGLVRFGCHTCTHPDLRALSRGQVRAQLADCKQYVETLTGLPCTTMAYPSGHFNDTVLQEVGALFDFAFTMENPNAYRGVGVSPLRLPRHYVARDVTAAQLLSMLAS